MQHINITAFESAVTTFLRRMCVYGRTVCGRKDRGTGEAERRGIYRNSIVNTDNIKVELCCSKYYLTGLAVNYSTEKELKNHKSRLKCK